MLISLDPQDTRPIYVQIVDEVRRALVLGTLASDDPLPSVRDLAVKLRVNPNTVSQAYRDLERQGMVYVRRGQGTYASPGQQGGAERRLLADGVAERALHDSRTTIAVLTAAEDVPLDQLILRTVESVRSRFGVEVEVELKHDLVVGAEERNALLRILHEALINAVRHGSAQQIFVRLSDGSRAGGPSLRITDDGSGFDVPGAVNAGKGLGLTSMQERAGILGGTLSIASRPGAGTVVEVELP